ncbi:MAG: AAA family ATPase [Candidatus Sulfopaludibacter sp.]|nr:AAA family ATPase [Candidatus Sulfopaludibacter sp.]
MDLGSAYRFRLELDVWGSPPKAKIKRELVLCDRKPVFDFLEGEVHLFNDNFQDKVQYPFDWFRSALATVQARPENRKLIKFKNWIENLHCLSLNPWNMSDLAEREEAQPKPDMSNFASWYRYMSQERAASASKLQEQLRRIMPGLESFDLRSAGTTARSVVLSFVGNGDDRKAQFDVTLNELSDGQRVMICLYALLNFVVGPESCVFLDEPENYIAIPEIQPWLMELQDRLDDGGQAILISHHPEMPNYLAPELGLVFERTGTGPARVRTYHSESSLSPAEQMARGW